MSEKFIIEEISASLSGVIPVAAYENLRPSYSMTVKPIGEQDPKEIFTIIEKVLHERFELEANRAKTDLIEKQYTNIRFREKNGKKYPSVTSILGWNKQWAVTVDQLKQYAARGTIVEWLILDYLKGGVWPNPIDVLALKEDVAILLGGSCGFSWANCTHEAFMEKYKDKIKIEKTKGVVFNDELLYSGEYDILGEYDGVRSIMDIKSGTFDMRQLAAYAICEKDIEQLVILPVGPTDNKCGYKKPVICTTIQDEYKKFTEARSKFRLRFGV